jgi:hypothetical protein
VSSTKWLVGVLFLLCAACAQNPEANRPKDVASDAVFVRGAKIGWWQKCAASENGQPVQCTIWNGAGSVLETGAFLPYDGGAPPTTEELKIDSDPTFPGPDRIVLRNGRILLPSSRFPELKKFVDWLKGKTSSPR